jgi:Glycosyltransferase family 10 (fucosyltransferase).
MQEPYVWGFTDWMVERHQPFSRVLTSHPTGDSRKYVVSHPAVPWHVNRSFDQLSAMEVPGKTLPLSWVVGSAKDLPGHLQRLDFLRILRQERDIPADLFGRAVRPIADKWDGLAPYRFSLAVENTVCSDYWTEKVADCFLSWTIPIYHGCPNFSGYFPSDSFIPIDIRNPREALAVIRGIVSSGRGEWERRMPALREARRRLLHEHQFFPHVATMVKREDEPPRDPTEIVVPPYRRSPRAVFWRRVRKIEMAIRWAGRGAS